ncbi:PTS sugar transporter subunit IIA [Clostridium perfringens]|uniref:PTS sugar transporter subunit IIA n=3 Tax=Clostridium perfringens TaxID=1502 RepID=A0AAW4J1N1_CLOPF|nr:PTS sugar transporter subunit IIA [Clostridium perfringens]EDT70838.1 PTS system, IIA component [Clostridium perfringens D str. JGS1721]EHP46020.1 PTS system, mannose/fructose/sorbose family, IIA component [Clostridium perfringens WAL-14572]EIA15762.1 PTS system, IIA component [Clostridium perfringens F262]EJT6165846.1 PTS sugar transporter subunit IIA [Clostridium perfringens]EJT6496482.1 PTS sugar transporter subunit IIA [Clostridium perfringens]
MIGVLVATHGEMAKGLFDAIDMICGTQEKFSIVSLKRGQDAESFGEELGEKINELNSDEGVVVLVDLLGATPMNQSALNLYKSDKVEVITGVNLPMVVTAAMERDCFSDIKELVEKIKNDGKDSVCSVRELLNI